MSRRDVKPMTIDEAECLRVRLLARLHWLIPPALTLAQAALLRDKAARR